MESRMGADFSRVVVHTDDVSAKSTRALSAQAFASGNHIYFGRGRYSPESHEGRRLIAHELTHVVQQQKMGRSMIQTQPDPYAPPLGPIGQAKSDIVAAIQRSVERLQAAISARDGIGITPHDVDAAMCQFFPGFGPDFYEDIIARIQLMIEWIPDTPVVRVPRPAPAGFRDAALLNLTAAPQPAQAMVRRELPAMAPGADYVAVFPEWDADASLQATRLLHEAIHFFFAGMYHAKPLNDAFAWQGLVSVLGGLPTGGLLQGRYPPCR